MKLGKSSQNTENLLVDTVLSVDLEPHGPLYFGLIVLSNFPPPKHLTLQKVNFRIGPEAIK